jgi:hypothetical protein
MFSKMRDTVKKALVGIIAFALGAGLAFVAFSIVYAVLGVLKKDGIVSDIAVILAVVLSIAFGLACALAKPKEKAAAPQDQQPEAAGEPAQVEEPAQAEEQPATAASVETVKTYKVAGVTHYEKNIMHFAEENEVYSYTKKELVDSWTGLDEEKIWKYEFSTPTIELVPEPDNAYDPNAIKVMADGLHVGYIKAEDCAHLLECIREQRISRISCWIGGGPYKLLIEDYDIDKDKQVFTLERDKINLFVHLSVTELPVSD